MAFFHEYPYTDFSEINLDWILKQLKEYMTKTDATAKSQEELKEYVDDFLDSLDMPAEVAAKLEEMMTTGELQEIILEVLEDNYGNDNYYARLHGKTIVVVGDSLTRGSGSATGNTYWDLIASTYGATVYNYGVSGSKISAGGDNQYSHDMATRIDDIITAHPHPDYFIIEGGANDKNQNVPIGTVNSIGNGSFIGAIKNIIVKVQRYNQKHTQLLFRTTFHRYDTANNLGLYEIDYVNAMKLACSIFSIPCYDNYSDAGISLAANEYSSPQNTWADVGLVDGSTASYHFSAAAYEYMLPKLTAFLCNAYAGNPSKPQAVHANGTLANGFTYKGYKTLRDDGLLEEVITYSGTVTPNAATYGDIHATSILYFAIPEGWTLPRHEGIQVTVQSDSGIVLFAAAGEGVNVISGRILKVGSSAATNVTVFVHVLTPVNSAGIGELT